MKSVLSFPVFQLLYLTFCLLVNFPAGAKEIDAPWMRSLYEELGKTYLQWKTRDCLFFLKILKIPIK